jgi:hypothetical protein
MLINGVSGDAGSFVEKLADERFASPFVAAQQRRKVSKYELHRWILRSITPSFVKAATDFEAMALAGRRSPLGPWGI